MGKKPISAEDVVRRIKTKQIGAIPVTIHDMTTIALVEIKNSTDESTDLEPIALVITDEIFAEIKPLFDIDIKYKVEGYEKQ